MRYKQITVLFAVFFLGGQIAYGQTPLHPSSAQGYGTAQRGSAGHAKTATGPPAKDTTIDEPGIKNPTTVDEPGIENPKSATAAKKNPTAIKSPENSAGGSDWSYFFQLFRFRNLGKTKIQFDAGLSVYSISYDTWNFLRLEPFVKLRWALLGKYLSLYTIFSTDFTFVNYELSHFKMGKTDVSFTASMRSIGKHSFGGGIQILLFGWKKLNVFGYAQTQSTSTSSASLEGAMLSINGMQIDLYDQIKDYVDITYAFERYDCGGTVSYQFFNWFTLWTTAGYIWINADIKLLLKQELTDVIRGALGAYSNELIPDRLSIKQASAFGMLGMKFKLYKRLHLNIEGMIMPTENPVYYGQLSFSFE